MRHPASAERISPFTTLLLAINEHGGVMCVTIMSPALFFTRKQTNPQPLENYTCAARRSITDFTTVLPSRATRGHVYTSTSPHPPRGCSPYPHPVPAKFSDFVHVSTLFPQLLSPSHTIPAGLHLRPRPIPVASPDTVE